jgi:hypothetical protein
MSNHCNRNNLLLTAGRTLVAATCALGAILLAESGASAQYTFPINNPNAHGYVYVDVEAGGGLASNYFGVTPGLTVNGSGGFGGVAAGFRYINMSEPLDNLIHPDGVRIGVLGGSMKGSTLYPTDLNTYTVQTPLAFYGEIEFANPVIDSFARMILPNMPIMIFSSAGLAGVDQTFSWSGPPVSGSTNVLEFAATSSVRIEWPFVNGIDMYLQWRTLYVAPRSVGVPAPVGVDGLINLVTLGAQFNASSFMPFMPH